MTHKQLQISYQLVQSVVTCSNHLTTPGARKVTRSHYHIKDPQILGSITVPQSKFHPKDTQ